MPQHKGGPYCHVPCYGALFGPHLFGHGTHVEAHASFGRRDSVGPDQEVLARQLRAYNQYHESSRTQIHSREVSRAALSVLQASIQGFFYGSAIFDRVCLVVLFLTGSALWFYFENKMFVFLCLFRLFFIY